MELRQLVAEPQHLPTIPTVVQSLIASFGRDDVSVGEIARLISTDPGLAAKLLRLANSAYFRTPRKIGSIDDALKLLGTKTTRNLVIGSGITAAFKNAPGLDIPQFWRHSLATACIARWLAERLRYDDELAFMTGLLHRIGQFPMRAGMKKEVLRLDAKVHPLDSQRAVAELEAFGFNHAAVGGELARRWHFPETIAQAIDRVPRPSDAHPDPPSAAIVHVATWRAHAHIFEESDEELAASYPAAVAGSLQIGKSWLLTPTTKGESANKPAEAMPSVADLAAGLEEMLDVR